MILIDGSHGEGGGSIARIALALSTLTQKSFEITDIRKNRPEPGLKSQHLFCIKALEELCNAKTEGASLGSTYLKYLPGKIAAKPISIDIQTAGSIPLFAQAVLVPSLFADGIVEFKITGGTEGKWAAPIDYFREVFLPHIQKFAKIECKTLKRGYYPKGQGLVELEVIPFLEVYDYETFDEFLKKIAEEIKPIVLVDRGELVQIKGVSHASRDLEHAQVAERQAKSAEVTLQKINCPIRISIEYHETPSTGSGITLWAIFAKNNEINSNNPIRLGADALGERGKRAEDVGIEAAHQMLKELHSTACVDRHLQDQLLPYMALAPGSKILVSEITNHTHSNISAIEQFLGKRFKIENNCIESM